MLSKISEFFELHIEKIVLAVVGLVCLVILFIYISPNKVEYDGDKLSPSRIDIEINKEAELLKQKLNKPAKRPEPYEPCLPRFASMFDSAISNIDVRLYPPQPSISSLEATFAREYELPFIGEVNEVAVEHIRAVAYVPIGSVNEQNLYKKGSSEPNDIDFVTVEGKFDSAQLYERFNNCFAGEAVKKEEWYDPCLARPLFAAVQLQRQELNFDGTWSDWVNVPRTRIDPHRNIFKVIEKVQDLPPGGLTVRMLQFDRLEVQINLLQPGAYSIASAEEQWYPPTIHKKYLEQQRQEELEARREALEKAREEREKELQERLDERRTARPDTRARTGGLGGGSGEYGTEGLYGGGSRTGSRVASRSSRSDRERYPSSTTSTRRSRTARGRVTDERQREEELAAMGVRDTLRGPLESDIDSELYALLITPSTEFAKMREPLVFWAHDDTVEPNKKYQYRIRLGVFNPIAGTNQFSEQDKYRKNDVILWSDFSNVTPVIEIPGKTYLFANDIQEAAKTVTVEVCKYALGYWHSEKFPVRQGEVIGKVKRVELNPEDEQSGITVPETIDYGTGAVLVDVTPVTNWSGGKKLAARDCYDMLYSSDGIHIERMPIRAMNWSRELQAAFGDIQKSIKQKKQPLRDWGSIIDESTRQISETGYGRERYDELTRRGSTRITGGRR